jgi:hypothetical protein
MGEVLQLFPQNQQDKHPRRLYGTCHRCERVDFLPNATDLGVKYCGHCWERDAIALIDLWVAGEISGEEMRSRMRLRKRKPDIEVAK